MLKLVTERRILGISGTARAAGISWSTAKALFDSGDIPVVRIGQRRYVTVEALEDYLNGGVK